MLDELLRRTPPAWQRRDKPLVMTDLSATAPQAREPRGPKRWEVKAKEREDRAVEAGALLASIDASMRLTVDLLTAPAGDDVLGHAFLVLPSTGFVSRAWKDTYRAVTVTNIGTAAVYVQNTPPAPEGIAPQQGQGLMFVPAGVQRTQPLRGTVVTIYGTPGQAVEITGYSRKREPQSGLCGPGTTGPVEVAVASPAAGVEWSLALPTTQPAMVQSASYTLATSATAGNRVSTITVSDSAARLIWRTSGAFNEPASSTDSYVCALGLVDSQETADAVLSPAPAIWVPPGCVLASSCQGIGLQAGDQYSAIVVTYRTLQ